MNKRVDVVRDTLGLEIGSPELREGTRVQGIRRSFSSLYSSGNREGVVRNISSESLVRAERWVLWDGSHQVVGHASMSRVTAVVLEHSTRTAGCAT